MKIAIQTVFRHFYMQNWHLALVNIAYTAIIYIASVSFRTIMHKDPICLRWLKCSHLRLGVVHLAIRNQFLFALPLLAVGVRVLGGFRE